MEDRSCVIFLLSCAYYARNWGTSTTLLESARRATNELTQVKSFHRSTHVNPHSATTQETADENDLLDKLEQIFRVFKAKGFAAGQVSNVVYTAPESFWSLSFQEKVPAVEEFHKKEEV